VSTMTTQPAGSPRTGKDDVLYRGHDVIHLGGEAAVVVPVDEYRRLQALEELASPQELEDAEAAAALTEYREWSEAGRPGAISHAEARRLLLGEDR
jgi:PHD/YefM family antitoxin component YafN of YafNO toxin-antitoxin module